MCFQTPNTCFSLGWIAPSDDDIWTYARDHEFIIVTKDRERRASLLSLTRRSGQYTS